MKNTVYIGWAKTRTKGEFIIEFYPVLTILHDRVSTTLLSQLLFKNELHAISTKISFCSTPIQFQLLKPQHNYKLTHKNFFFFFLETQKYNLQRNLMLKYMKILAHNMPTHKDPNFKAN